MKPQTTKPETMQADSCYHCGEECKDSPLAAHDKHFCCEGCKLVFELLDEKGLDGFYEMPEKPGIKGKNLKGGERFAYLDKPEMLDQMADFNEQGVCKINFRVPGVHCSSCIWLLENLPAIDGGIRYSNVDFLKKETSVTFSTETTSLRKVVELMSAMGYEPELTLDSLKESAAKKAASAALKSEWFKLGVAGFCFGNVMLLSFPEYFSIDAASLKGFSHFFGYLNTALSVPVLFYSARGYLVSAYKALKHGQFNIDIPISIGIAALFGVSLYEIFSFTGSGYFDSFTGLIFFLLLGKTFQRKGYESLSFERDYQSYFPISATRLKDGQRESVSVSDLVAGDRILIHNEELIPTDAVLVGGKANIDYSFVTGESQPIGKKTGDKLFAGGRQKGETIEMEVLKPFSKAYLTQLWNNETFKKEKHGGFANITNKRSKKFTIALLILSFVAGIAHFMLGTGLGLKAFSSILIVACPCALALSAPFALGSTLRVLARKGFYLKNIETVERLAEVDTIVFDKTGTLSTGEKAEVLYEGMPLTEEEMRMAAAAAEGSTHPLSQIVFNYLEKKGAEHKKAYLESFKETPGKGLNATVNGQNVSMGKLSFIAPGHGDPLNQKGANVYLSIGEKLKGKFTIRHHYREGLEALLEKVGANYSLYVLSGDNESEKDRLSAMFPESAQLVFNQSPQDKLDFLDKLESAGRKTMMIGDGLNDAGALRRSGVGVSLTENLSAFTPASDAILQASSLANIDKLIAIAKKGISVVYICFTISLLYNCVGLWFAVQGALSPVIAAILMPLSSVSVAAFSSLAVFFNEELKIKN